jgi:hypothetical protein
MGMGAGIRDGEHASQEKRKPEVPVEAPDIERALWFTVLGYRIKYPEAI